MTWRRLCPQDQLGKTVQYLPILFIDQLSSRVKDLWVRSAATPSPSTARTPPGGESHPAKHRSPGRAAYPSSGCGCGSVGAGFLVWRYLEQEPASSRLAPGHLHPQGGLGWQQHQQLTPGEALRRSRAPCWISQHPNSRVSNCRDSGGSEEVTCLRRPAAWCLLGRLSCAESELRDTSPSTQSASIPVSSRSRIEGHASLQPCCPMSVAHAPHPVLLRAALASGPWAGAQAPWASARLKLYVGPTPAPEGAGAVRSQEGAGVRVMDRSPGSEGFLQRLPQGLPRGVVQARGASLAQGPGLPTPPAQVINRSSTRAATHSVSYDKISLGRLRLRIPHAEGAVYRCSSSVGAGAPGSRVGGQGFGACPL